MKEDVYDRITNRIVESLEAGVRPWLKPWNAEHAAGKITQPLRHNGQPYSLFLVNCNKPSLAHQCRRGGHIIKARNCQKTRKNAIPKSTVRA